MLLCLCCVISSSTCSNLCTMNIFKFQIQIIRIIKTRTRTKTTQAIKQSQIIIIFSSFLFCARPTCTFVPAYPNHKQLSNSTTISDLYDECSASKSKSCVGIGSEGCIQTKSCNIFLTYVLYQKGDSGSSKAIIGDGERLHFTVLGGSPDLMNGTGTNLKSQYVAIGFSSDNMMGNDAVVSCIVYPESTSGNGTPTLNIQVSFNTQTENIPEPQAIADLSDQEILILNDRLLCAFSIPATLKILSATHELNKRPSYLLVAYGQSESPNKISYQKHDTNFVSLHSINFAIENRQQIILIPKSFPARPAVYAHVILTVVTFITLVPTATLIARFLKSSHLRCKVFRRQIWFILHSLGLLTGFLFLIISQLLLVSSSSTNNLNVSNSPQRSSGEGVHNGFGAAIITFYTVQIIIGSINQTFFSRSMSHNGKIMSFIHWLLGILTFMFGIIQIFLSPTLMARSMIYCSVGSVITLIWVFFYLAIYIALTFITFLSDVAEFEIMSSRLYQGKKSGETDSGGSSESSSQSTSNTGSLGRELEQRLKEIKTEMESQAEGNQNKMTSDPTDDDLKIRKLAQQKLQKQVDDLLEYRRRHYLQKKNKEQTSRGNVILASLGRNRVSQAILLTHSVENIAKPRSESRPTSGSLPNISLDGIPTAFQISQISDPTVTLAWRPVENRSGTRIGHSLQFSTRLHANVTVGSESVRSEMHSEGDRGKVTVTSKRKMGEREQTSPLQPASVASWTPKTALETQLDVSRAGSIGMEDPGVVLNPDPDPDQSPPKKVKRRHKKTKKRPSDTWVNRIHKSASNLHLLTISQFEVATAKKKEKTNEVEIVPQSKSFDVNDFPDFDERRNIYHTPQLGKKTRKALNWLVANMRSHASRAFISYPMRSYLLREFPKTFTVDVIIVCFFLTSLFVSAFICFYLLPNRLNNSRCSSEYYCEVSANNSNNSNSSCINGP